MEHAVPLMKEAWAHRRRRYRSLATIALSVGALAALVYVIRPAGSGPIARTSAHDPSAIVAVRPSAVLSRRPYMGVAACPRSQASTCDRVGVAVWLKRPASTIAASIAGEPLKLHGTRDNGSLSAARGPRTLFIGYLQPAGIGTRLHVQVSDRTSPAPSTESTVRLMISYRAHQAVTQLRVPLAAGWG
jgi:hypothetical protein